MQIFIYAMPAIALYEVLIAPLHEGPPSAFIQVMPSIFATALLGALLVAVTKWRRHRTTHWRNYVVSCALVGCFIGSHFLPQATRVATAACTRLLLG